MAVKRLKVGKPKPQLPVHEDVVAPVQLLNRKQLLARLGDISYPTVWAKVKAGTFPRPRMFGGRVFWIASEVDAHLAALPPAPLTKIDKNEAA